MEELIENLCARLSSAAAARDEMQTSRVVDDIKAAGDSIALEVWSRATRQYTEPFIDNDRSVVIGEIRWIHEHLRDIVVAACQQQCTMQTSSKQGGR